MKRALTLFYFIFFVGVFIPSVISSDPEPLSLPSILVVAPLFLAAASIFLYLLLWKPKRFAWFWKIIPPALVGFLVITWCNEFIWNPTEKLSLVNTVGATLFGFVTLLPAFYLSFRFAYSKGY